MANDNQQRPPANLREQAEAATEGLPAFADMIGRWWQAKPSERKPYMQEVLDANGKPVLGPDGKPLKAEVRNSPIDPKYGFRTKESPPVSGYELGYNVANNLHPFEVARDAIKGIPGIPAGLLFLDSLRRGAFAGGMTPEQYRDTFWNMGAMPMGGDPNAAAFAMMNVPKMDIKDAEAQRQKDIQNYRMALSLYGVYNTKTNELTMDWNGLARDLTQHPAEVGSLFVGGGAGFAKAAQGMAKLAGLENGLTFTQNLSRLGNIPFKPFSGTASAMQSAREFGTVLKDAAATAAASKIGQGTQGVLDLTGKAMRLTGLGLDPVTPNVGRLTAGATSSAINLARRIPVYKVSIYTPEFRKEWGAFQKEAEGQMLRAGQSPETVGSPAVQQQLWDQFKAQTGNRFDNPFTDKANKAFDALEAQGRGFDRNDYIAPHIGKEIDKTLNAKGKGITPAIIAEGAIRSAAPEGAGLSPRVAGQPKPPPIGITRSTATGEAPGWFQQNEGIGSGQWGRSTLESDSRAATQQQLGQHLSESLGGRGASPVTHQDIADDFIQTQINNRNAYRQAYEQSAASEGGGAYSDPDAFAQTFASEYEAALRQQNPNLSTRDILDNQGLFPNAGKNYQSTSSNILSWGKEGGPLTVEIPQLPGSYSYNRATSEWIPQNGAVPPKGGILKYLEDNYGAQMQGGSGNNLLNLKSLETERRRLLAAAEKAYKSGNIDDYRAINAQIDALDNTAIKMAPTHSGPNVDQAIQSLEEGRRGFREWRQTGIDAPDTSAYAPIKTAAQKVEALTDVDPLTGRYTFSTAPGARTDVGDIFRNKIVGEESLLPQLDRPTEFVSALTDPNSRLLSNPDQVTSLIRSGYARPGVNPQELANYHSLYQDVDVLSPAEQNLFNRSMAAQAATDPNKIPQRSPWQLVPDLEASMGPTRRAFARAEPLVKGLAGYGVGSVLDYPIQATFGFDPNLRYLIGGGSAASGPASRAVDTLGIFKNVQGGAPAYSVQVPTSIPTTGLRVSGLVSAAQNTAQNEQERGKYLSLFPDQNQTADKAQEEAAAFERMFGAPEKKEEQPPQPQSTGGRAAYKSGGAVNDIEPLVRNLMNRAQQAKKMTNKDTEVLLNSHDDAIASALEVAQKAI